MSRLVWDIVIWLDRHVFLHKWSWLCNLAWDNERPENVDKLEALLNSERVTGDLDEFLDFVFGKKDDK